MLENMMKLELLMAERERIAKTNPKYVKIEEQKQDILEELRIILKEDYELVERLMDYIDVQEHILMKHTLGIGLF